MQISSAGFSLLELLLALFLVNLAIFLSFPALKQSLVHKKQLREKNEERVLIRRLFLEVQRGLDRAEVFYAINSLTVFENAQELTLDAKVGSSAITFLHLSPLLLSKLDDGLFCVEKPGATTEDKTLIKESAHWLAVNENTYSMISGEVKKAASASGACLTGQSYKGALKSESAFSHLIPILDHYSLYIDQENKFRRLSHILNNKQTLLTGLSDFKLSIEDTMRHGALIKVSIQTEKGTTNEKLFLYGTNETQSLSDILL